MDHGKKLWSCLMPTANIIFIITNIITVTIITHPFRAEGHPLATFSSPMLHFLAHSWMLEVGSDAAFTQNQEGGRQQMGNNKQSD